MAASSQRGGGDRFDHAGDHGHGCCFILLHTANTLSATPSPLKGSCRGPSASHSPTVGNGAPVRPGATAAICIKLSKTGLFLRLYH